jgi:hypothetical protein
MGAMSFVKLTLFSGAVFRGAVWAAAKPDAETKTIANLENGCILKTASFPAFERIATSPLARPGRADPD